MLSDGRITSLMVGMAMALSPYAMAVPSHHARAHCHDSRDGEIPSREKPTSAGCHAACTRDDKKPDRPSK